MKSEVDLSRMRARKNPYAAELKKPAMATLLCAEADAETHFLLRAQRGEGNQRRGTTLLKKARGRGKQPPKR